MNRTGRTLALGCLLLLQPLLAHAQAGGNSLLIPAMGRCTLNTQPDTQAGGMFGLYFSGADDIVTFDDVMGSDADLFKRFFHLMLEGGVYLAPSAFEAGFTSIAHGEAELKLTLDAAERAFAALK